mgnify:FL=1
MANFLAHPKMSIVRRIKINAGIGMIGGVVVILAAMGKAVILGRYLDLESFGYYVICLNAVSIIKLILSIGFEPTLLRFIPEFEAEKADHKVASLLVLLIYIASVISLLTIGLVFFGSDWVAEKVYENPNLASSFKIMGFATCAHLFSGISVGLLRLSNKFHLAQIPPIVGGITIPLLLVYLEINGGLKLESAIIATAIGEALTILLFLILMVLCTRSFWSFGGRILSLQPLRGHFGGLRNTLGQTSLFGILNGGSEVGGVFLLGIFGSKTQVALAGMAVSLSRPLTVLQSSLGSAVNPEVSRLYARGEIANLLIFLRRYIRSIGLLVCAGILVVPILGPWCINFLLRPAYLDALPVFMVLVISYGLTLVFQPFLAVAIMRGEVGRRNILVSFRFIYLGIAVYLGINAMAIALVLLIGNLSVRFLNDLPLYKRLKKLADHPKNLQAV